MAGFTGVCQIPRTGKLHIPRNAALTFISGDLPKVAIVVGDPARALKLAELCASKYDVLVDIACIAVLADGIPVLNFGYSVRCPVCSHHP